MFLMSLIENDVVALVDSGAFNAELAQCANHHLGMLVPREVITRARNAPIEVALVMEDGASSRSTADKVDGANARRFRLGVVGAVSCGIKNAKVDLGPRVLVAADDYTRSVHVEEQDGAVRGRFPQDVVLNREVQVRVVAGGHVALQLILRV
jgi:hypothetical protein